MELSYQNNPQPGAYHPNDAEDRRTRPPNPKDVIQDFLTVPGIAGIALIDGSTIPRLYSADPKLQIHHPKIFLANVTPILRTLPSEVQQLEFFFGTYNLYVSRLGYGFTVAVLTQCAIEWRNNSQDLRIFCETVQAHLKVSIPLLETWASARYAARHVKHHEPIASSSIQPAHSTAKDPVIKDPVIKDSNPSTIPDLETYLNAFNHLTAIAADTLGSTIITSQLKRSCPDAIDITINIAKGQLNAPNQSLSHAQLETLRQWSENFRLQCSKIIRGFDTTATQAGLTREEATLLSGESTAP